MSLTTGDVLRRRYHIYELIGEGGMGAVYKAKDTYGRRRCAIKETKKPNPQFMREAQVLAALQHPNLPQVWDFFELASGQQYLVMEYVRGVDLGELLRRQNRPFSETQVLGWAKQLLGALAYIHSRNPPVVHRDIKPQNIKITPEGCPILVDFGLAKNLSGQSTSTSAKGLTRNFAPIEQYTYDWLSGMPEAQQYFARLYQNGWRSGPYSDIYSLGATLYYILTNKTPPEAPDRIQYGYPLKPIRQVNPYVSAHLEAVISRALEIDPARRFQSAVEMQRALVAPPISRTPARQQYTQQQTPKISSGVTRRQTNKTLWIIWSIVLLIGIAAIILLGVNWHEDNNEEETVTSLPTPKKIAHVENSVTPSSTEITAPTTTAVPTSTPRRQEEVITPVPSSPTSAPPRSSPSPSATEKPPPEPVPPSATPPRKSYAAPRLLAPEDNVYLPIPGSVLPDNEVEFRWQWEGNLPSDEYFDLRIWSIGWGTTDCAAGGEHLGRAWTKHTSHRLNMEGIFEEYGTRGCWTVAIIQGKDGKLLNSLSPESEPRRFEYVPE